ncbi:membrane progestin receptor beta-like isoform X2 [Scophthalmus maximus]|nr:membrane progestin receptor beta-like isoform X2 [Scophthalmus maximus]
MMPRVSFTPPSPCLPSLPVLERLLPALPPTLRDVDVPRLFREPFILSGYRPVGLSWRCYVLSLFQMHNETVNAWSHLLAAACLVVRFTAFAVLRGGGILGFRLQGPEGQGFSVDVSSLPLVLYVFSAVTYLSCSAAAHLLQSRSEQAHHSLCLLDYVGVAVYQYGSALALCLYSSDSAWTQSMLGKVFLPAAALLAWLSCITCCYAKINFRRPYPTHRKLCQLVPMGVAYLLVINPVAHRLATCSWTNRSALPLHFLQVVLFLLSAVFFSCPVPERFAPGRFDIVGHGHQLSHILLSLCTLAQQEALLEDFLWRRPALVREFGEERLLLACASFFGLALCCAATALAMRVGACDLMDAWDYLLKSPQLKKLLLLNVS